MDKDFLLEMLNAKQIESSDMTLPEEVRIKATLVVWDCRNRAFHAKWPLEQAENGQWEYVKQG